MEINSNYDPFLILTIHKEKQGQRRAPVRDPARVFILMRRACRTLYQRGGKSRIEIRTAILGGMEAYEPFVEHGRPAWKPSALYHAMVMWKI